MAAYLSVTRSDTTSATELENAPQATISTKPRANLGEGCVAAQTLPGALVVQGAFMFQGTSL